MIVYRLTAPSGESYIGMSDEDIRTCWLKFVRAWNSNGDIPVFLANAFNRNNPHFTQWKKKVLLEGDNLTLLDGQSIVADQLAMAEPALITAPVPVPAPEKKHAGIAKDWVVTTPEGEEIRVTSLRAWCKGMKLDPASVSRSGHRGYKARKVEDA